MDFATSCCFGILPGDASIVFTYMTQLHKALTASELSLDIPLTALAFGIGALLFEVVILRIYLERSADDDLAIYNLIMAQKDLHTTRRAGPPPPRIERALSLSEQVVAAFDGVLNNKDTKHQFLQIFWKGNLQPSAEELKFDGAIAKVVDPNGEAFQWPASEDPGLTGGTLPSLRAKADGPPRPRPIKRRRTLEEVCGMVNYNVYIVADLQKQEQESTLPVPNPDDVPNPDGVPLPNGLLHGPTRRSKRLKMQLEVETGENERGKGAGSRVLPKKRKREQYD